ncbi:MAG TPA: hypothetical protein DCP28_38095, partial [Cytophagales bacterium]|nr:hypothetical protein [Cytophagales bacterium]
PPPPVFDDPSDVVLINWNGETVALMSTHGQGTGTQSILPSSSTVTGDQLHISPFLGSQADGQAFDRMYFFADRFSANFEPTRLLSAQNSANLTFGDYDASKQVSSFTGSDKAYLSQIDLSWTEVSDADGYLLFREDQGGPYPLATLVGAQLTSYSDLGLDIYAEYTYYVIPFSLTNHALYMGAPAVTTGHTKGFDFTATGSGEAQVTFDYNFDNHLLVQLDQQAAYVEITDESNGTIIFGDELTMTDIAEDALLFDYALDVKGTYHSGGGVHAEPNLDVSGLDAWTLELWFQFDSDPAYLNTYYHELYSDGNVTLMTDRSQRVLIANFYGQQFRWVGDSPNWTEWTHLSVTYDGTHATVYHNGKAAMMYNVSTLEEAYSHPVSNGSLNNTLQFGQRLALTDDKHGNLNGSLGMIRMWDQARTQDQVAYDYEHIFDSAVPGLLAQWTFADQDLNPVDPLTGASLSIQTDNSAEYPIRWNAAYDFFAAEMQNEITAWLDRPEADGASRDFSIKIYESGSGRIISEGTDAATFSHPGTATLTVAEVTNAPYALDVTLSPATFQANKYNLYRHRGTETTLLQEVVMTANEDGTAYLPFTYQDAYAYGNRNTP